MIDLGVFDPSDKASVDRLAQILGAQWAEALAPFAAMLDPELRAAFFGYALGAPFGAMAASIGVENAEAVAYGLLQACRDVADSKRSKAH